MVEFKYFWCKLSFSGACLGRLDDFLSSQHHLSMGVKRGYGTTLRAFEEIAGIPFEQCFLDESLIHKVLSVLDERLEDSSWNLWLSRYQRLAKWLCDPEDETCPKLWRKIPRKHIDWEEKLKDKWLSEEEFYHVLDVVDHPRDKALLGVCVEGALRAGELLSLKVRHCERRSYGFDVTFSGKTGTSSVPVVLFAPLLRDWLNHHPAKHNPESPLWVRREGGWYGTIYGAIVYNTANRVFKKYASRAGIKRNVSLHFLRHTKITWTYKNKRVRISDDMARKMFRWSKGSQMPSRYSHLVGVDSKDAFLALAGVKEVTEKIEAASVLERKKCFNCGELNSAEALYCARCGCVLSEEEARRQVEKQKMIDVLFRKWKEENP